MASGVECGPRPGLWEGGITPPNECPCALLAAPLRSSARHLARRLPTLSARASSEIDLHPQLDDAIRRDPEVLRRRSRVARDEREESLSPAEHAARARRQQGLAAEEVARSLRRVRHAEARRRHAHDLAQDLRL